MTLAKIRTPLAGRKLALIVSALVALAAAMWSVERIGLSPPGVSPRSWEIATATTHVIVDTPRSALVDLRQDTYDLTALRNRAILLGNVIASSGVRSQIAREVGVPVEELQIQAPLTSAQLAPSAASGHRRQTGDIVKSPEEYRLNIEANPSVPVLDIYGQAPTAESAAALVNASVTKLRGYLDERAVAEGTPENKQIDLIQLGRGRGAVINEGVGWQVAVLAFLVTFGICIATVVLVARLRAGWRVAGEPERSVRTD